MQDLITFFPGEFHGQRSLVGYSPRDHKESDITKRLTLSLFSPISWASQMKATFSCEVK